MESCGINLLSLSCQSFVCKNSNLFKVKHHMLKRERMYSKTYAIMFLRKLSSLCENDIDTKTELNLDATY